MNYVSITKLIRFCERETPAQLLLEYAINEAIIAEREACALVCDDESEFANMQANQGGSALDDGRSIGADACAAAIRERGEKK